jgi:tRNA(adenine34) deaminase
VNVPAGGDDAEVPARPPERPRIIRLKRITDPIPDEALEDGAFASPTDPEADSGAGPASDAGMSAVEPETPTLSDDDLMRAALVEARLAATLDEVPVGAVVALNGVILARAHNLREAHADPTAHAEILALREAARRLGSWRLEGATLAVTLEPCFMCAGALVNARVETLVFGTPDPKAGAVGSLGDVARDPRLNHRLVVRSGVLADECGGLLRAFFGARRR